jgi:hypothetical protein
MTPERRKSPRTITLKTGKLIVAAAAPAIDCAILDESEAGACLLVPDATVIPKTFDLAIDRSERIFACRLAWNKGNRIGVSFQTKRKRER